MLAITKHRSFLKWAGNKFNCLEHILSKLNPGKRLIEPFAGSGAIFLNTDYPVHVLNDLNTELINLFQCLKNEGQEFIDNCRSWFTPENNVDHRYYQLREQFNQSSDPHERAILFLYLNRHGYNGLCRFSKKGRFNVPFGLYSKPYFPEKEMQYFHQKAQSAILSSQDFNDTFKLIQRDDVVYCDPPYYPLGPSRSFTAYTRQQFLAEDQLKLAELALEAAKKGAHVFISNHDVAFTREIYAQAQHIYDFTVPRFISSKANQRHAVNEILAHFYSD
jgi:DNA adenine methylase